MNNEENAVKFHMAKTRRRQNEAFKGLMVNNKGGFAKASYCIEDRNYHYQDFMQELYIRIFEKLNIWDARVGVKLLSYLAINALRPSIDNFRRTMGLYKAKSVPRFVRSGIKVKESYKPTHNERVKDGELLTKRVDVVIPKTPSLNVPAYRGATIEAMDVIKAPDEVNNDLSVYAETILGQLKEPLKKTVSFYYGFETGENMSLAQVGEIMGVTTEMARQRKDNALDKIRAKIKNSEKCQGPNFFKELAEVFK